MSLVHCCRHDDFFDSFHSRIRSFHDDLWKEHDLFWSEHDRLMKRHFEVFDRFWNDHDLFVKRHLDSVRNHFDHFHNHHHHHHHHHNHHVHDSTNSNNEVVAAVKSNKSELDVFPKIENNEVSISLQLPEKIDVTKLKVTNCNGDLIVDLHDSSSGPDGASRSVCYYSQTSMPARTNFTDLKWVLDDKTNILKVTAPVKTE